MIKIVLKIKNFICISYVHKIKDINMELNKISIVG